MVNQLSQFLKECVSSSDAQNKEQFIANLNKLLDYKNCWSSLEHTDYSKLLLYVIGSYEHFDMITEAISFFRQEYLPYNECCKYDYSIKSILFELMAKIYLKSGDNNMAEDAIKSSVFFCFIHNISYDRFEYFSFRSASKHALNDIRNNTLSLSNPTLFNDPLDTLLLKWNSRLVEAAGTSLEKELLEIRQRTYGHIKARCFARKDKLPEVNQFAERTAIIKSQNIEELNPLMWAHYADSHKGICIKYVFPANFVCNDDPVNRTWSMMANMQYVPHFTFNAKNPFTVEDALLKKFNIWEYENEVRLIHYDPNYTEDFKELHLPENSIAAIYFGINCPALVKEEITKIIGGNVGLFQMEFDSNEVYKMQARKVN